MRRREIKLPKEISQVFGLKEDRVESSEEFLAEEGI